MKKIKFLILLLKNRFKFNKGFIQDINKHYKISFDEVKIKDCAIIMPHCLIDKKCPAKFSKTDGILCIKCGLCKCGDIKRLAEEKGY